MPKPCLIAALFMTLFSGLLCAQENHGLKSFHTPDADMKGEWDFEHDPKLPDVLILGDSISISYTLMVREKLKGKANVFRPMEADGKQPENCGDTARGIDRLDRWVGDRKWEVIHFNWGLWDLCYRWRHSKEQGGRDKVNGKLTTTLPRFEKNLDQLATRLKSTGAKLIWANITVVPEGEAGRIAGDELNYNAVAKRVMDRHGIPINDLHSISKEFPEDHFSGPGDVHFANIGCAKLATQVAGEIGKLLD